MRRKVSKAKAVEHRETPTTPRDVPVFCPLFPTVKVASVGKTVLKRLEYDEGGELHEMIIVHPRVNAEMDEADIMAIAGGGEYYVAVHKNDGTGHMLSHRKLELDGAPKYLDDDEDDDMRAGGGKPTVIEVPGGEPIIVPANLKGAEQQAFIAQQQHLRSLQKQAEANGAGGGTMGAMITGMFGMMGSMVSGGSQNNTAMDALRNALDAANREKITMLTQHGDALRALREEHAKAADKLREDLSKERDEVRRLTLQMETKIAEAVRNTHQETDKTIASLRSDVNRLESSLLGRDREIVRLQGAARASSELVEMANIIAPRADALLGKLGGAAGLPKELQATVDAINKEILPTVRKLAPLAARLGGEPEPPVADPAPQPAAATPAPSGGTGSGMAAPDMPT